MRMKIIDLFVGVKAEQTLRDITRAAAEAALEGEETPELCPVGKKDWIAGKRVSSPLPFEEVTAIKKAVIQNLIDLKSHQRIRHENLRLYPVRPPVPVFKDSPPEETAEDTHNNPAISKKGTVECPVCGAEVHNYNIQYDPWGKMVGCYLCRGESGHRR